MTNPEIFDGNYITEEMRMFRKSFRQFVEKECVPHCRNLAQLSLPANLRRHQ